MVGGCLAQKDRDADPAAGAARRRGVRHPQRRTGPPSCCAAAARRRARSSRSSRQRSTTPSSRRRCRSGARSTTPAWVTIQIGCDNTLRLLHRARACGAGRSAGPSATSSPRSSAGRRRRRRGHAARPERELLRPRPHLHARPAAPGRRGPSASRPAVRRPAARRRRGRRHPAGALHQPPPEGPAARDDRGHGRRRRPCASTCTCPLQAGSDRMLAAMHRGYTAERYLERLAAARAAIPDLAVTTDLIVGFPGETDDDFERTLEVVAEAALRQRLHVHLLAPARHRGGRAGRPTSSPPTCAAERFERLRRGRRAQRRWRRHEARVGRVEEVLVEGPSKRDPAVLTGRTRQNKLVHFRGRPAPLPAGHAAPLVDVTARRRPPPPAGELVEVIARAPPPHPHPGRRAAADGDGRRPHLVARRRPRPPASRRWRSRWPGGLGDVEIVSVDSMQVYRGMDIGTAKPTPAERAEVRPPPRRPGRSRRGRSGRSTFQAGAARPRSPTSRRAVGRAAARRRHRPLPAGGRRRPRAARPRTPRCAAELEAEPDTGRRSTTGCAPLDPVAAAPHGADEPAPGRAGARGDARQRPAVLVLRSRPRRLPRRRPSRSSASASPATLLDARIAAALRRQLDAGFLDEVAARSTAARPGWSRTAAPGPRLPRAARPSRTGDVDLDEAVEAAVRRTRRFARRQRAWFRRDPRITLARRSGDAEWSTARLLRGVLASRGLRGSYDCVDMRLTKHHGLGNDFLVAARPRRTTAARRRPGAPRCATGTAGIGADGLIRRPRVPAHRRRRRAAWCSATPTAAGPR